MNTELKQVLDEVKGLIQKERETNDERLVALEKTGTELPEIRDKADKTSDALNQASEKLEAIQKEQEETRKLAEQNAEQVGTLIVGGPGGDPKAKEKLTKNCQIFNAAVNMKRGDRKISISVDQYQTYRDAFSNMVRHGYDGLSEEYKNALRIASDPDGGYWVPTEQSDEVKRRLFDTSPIRQIANVMTITSDSIEFPTDTNKATSGGWVGEQESRSETATPQVGTQKLWLREQYAAPQVTQRLLNMATINVESWLEGKIAEIFGITENTAYVSGDGAERPRGFLDYKSNAVATADSSRSWGVLEQVVTGASGGFPTVSGSTASDPDALITTISKLKPEYRAGARWVMNRSVEATVRKLKDADGRYFIDFGNLEAGTVGFSLFGFPITTAEDMPDFSADSYSIAFGNFRTGFLIIDGPGMRVLRDPYTAKPEVIFYSTKLTGSDIVDTDAIKLVKASA